MFYCVVEKDQYVFRQNDPASCFFIVHEGLVQVESEEGRGTMFRRRIPCAGESRVA